MKRILILLIVVSPILALSQKIKYNKDVYPLIKEGKPEAFYKLKEYVQEDPKHSNATYWLAKYYDAFAFEYVSAESAKLAVQFYNACLTNTSSLNLTVLHAHRYPDAKGVESEELYKSLKDFIHSKIKELDDLIKSTTNASTKKSIKVSSMKELSEKLKIYFPEEVKNLAITDIQVEYSERTYNGKSASNGPIQIKGLDKSTELIVTVVGKVDCGWLLDDYKKSEEEKEKPKCSQKLIDEYKPTDEEAADEEYMMEAEFEEWEETCFYKDYKVVNITNCDYTGKCLMQSITFHKKNEKGQYIQIKNVEELFNDKKHELLTLINKAFKAEFDNNINEHEMAECYETSAYENQRFNDILVTFSEDGFFFSSYYGLVGFCYYHYLSFGLSLDEMEKYLK
jgi:hypothetical protein